MMAAAAQTWLVKSEPHAFSWADLLASPRRTTAWDGVRNYQARNYLRDGFRRGDRVFFYQSCTKPLAIVGSMRVVRTAYPDPSQFDPNHAGFEPASQSGQARWLAVDLQAEHTFAAPVTLASLRLRPPCASMPLLQRGSRLSVQPVSQPAAREIFRLAGL